MLQEPEMLSRAWVSGREHTNTWPCMYPSREWTISMKFRHARFISLPLAALAFAVSLPPAQAEPLLDPFSHPAHGLNEKTWAC
ncbi:MAG TPA: hypothetical protein VMM15_28410 [Bradyrhizobium sp.]|nr:hypothetical protein [Bradyrhizobium sp.]